MWKPSTDRSPSENHLCTSKNYTFIDISLVKMLVFKYTRLSEGQMHSNMPWVQPSLLSHGCELLRPQHHELALQIQQLKDDNFVHDLANLTAKIPDALLAEVKSDCAH